MDVKADWLLGCIRECVTGSSVKNLRPNLVNCVILGFLAQDRQDRPVVKVAMRIKELHKEGWDCWVC